MPSVLITGANRGIGLEFARQYAVDGWDVIATARETNSELDAFGVRVELLDLSDPDDVAGFAGRFESPLDLFISNAGTSHPKEVDGAGNARDWQAMMTVNVISPYRLGRSLLPHMSPDGKVIAISSGMGSIGDNSGGWVPYRTSKAALNMAWNSLALEGKSRGIAVVALSPGWVKTRMGGPGAEITVEESVGDMRALIGRLTMNETGKFLRRDGSELPW
jgi:NAD(P)-dependent dehydrogenase (short-subunit alcohol dehydrogenase family)